MTLRDHLDQITTIGDATKHRGKIIALAYLHPHSIEYLHSDHPIERYTCIVHALNFIAYEPYENIAKIRLGVFAGSAFLKYLLEEELLEESLSPQAGDMIFYSDDHQITHAGVCIGGNTIESKWGEGNLWRHGLWEVPALYGNNIQYYSSLPREEMIEYFIDFAETKGIQFETVRVE